MKALILDNKVIQVESVSFPVAEPLKWITCPIGTQVGYDVLDDVAVAPSEPVVSFEDTKAAKLKELSSLRYTIETGGFMYGGYKINTDDRSKTLLMGARIEAREKLDIGGTFSLNWKTEDGFVQLSAEIIITMSDAVRVFVQACFDAERSHFLAIESLQTVSEIQQYDISTGWTFENLFG